ncbi:MAG: hypothetical protein JNL21_24840 [Myxococcales bacterium]|nr:hypothetical protein [Myxococcales bacterium]
MAAPCCTRIDDEASYLTDVLQSEGVVVAAFSDGPDPALDARLAELCDLLEGRARLVAVDRRRQPGPARLHRVEAFPTLVFFRNGLEIGRLAGLRTAAQYALAIEITETALPGMETVHSPPTTLAR